MCIWCTPLPAIWRSMCHTVYIIFTYHIGKRTRILCCVRVYRTRRARRLVASKPSKPVVPYKKYVWPERYPRECVSSVRRPSSRRGVTVPGQRARSPLHTHTPHPLICAATPVRCKTSSRRCEFYFPPLLPHTQKSRPQKMATNVFSSRDNNVLLLFIVR